MDITVRVVAFEGTYSSKRVESEIGRLNKNVHDPGRVRINTGPVEIRDSSGDITSLRYCRSTLLRQLLTINSRELRGKRMPCREGV